MGIITLKNVSYAYETDTGRVQAVSDVSLDIAEGEFLCILGHNGSGKSTLAKLMNALLLPESGSITVKGMDTKDEEESWKIRRHAGMVFQNPDNQIVSSIVEEDIAFGPENLGMPREEMITCIRRAIKAVGMEGHEQDSPAMLSGGQKQRVAIAGVLAMLPDVIICDEPTAMLDPKGRAEVLETIHRLNKRLGKTIVLITHYMEETVDADRIVV
ncbi:MAG: energy-coupling factor transporter ATPase, partial [Christensenellaceae bacterium]|nr:energy-coupling factor transporter ATPase [Christensenellaceae bacterium]